MIRKEIDPAKSGTVEVPEKLLRKQMAKGGRAYCYFFVHDCVVFYRYLSSRERERVEFLNGALATRAPKCDICGRAPRGERTG